MPTWRNGLSGLSADEVVATHAPSHRSEAFLHRDGRRLQQNGGGRRSVNRQKSRTQFERAQRVIPGGVNSPARAFGAVGGEPLFIDRGEGAFLVDVDGNRLLDYVGSWGPLILGHDHPEVVAAVEGGPVERGQFRRADRRGSRAGRD